MKLTNVTSDHINKWSKRELVNMTDEMSWVVSHTIKADKASGSDL